MIAETAAFAMRISLTAMRPEPSAFFKSNCATTPRNEFASMARACACRDAGKTSTIRSTVLRALFVCSVPKTSKPVSAAVSARAIVSRSRISRDFALGDDASFVIVYELDRFLDRHNVPRKIFVNVIDQRRQGG